MDSRLRALSNRNPYSIRASSPHCRASRSMASIRSPARRLASVMRPGSSSRRAFSSGVASGFSRPARPAAPPLSRDGPVGAASESRPIPDRGIIRLHRPCRPGNEKSEFSRAPPGIARRGHAPTPAGGLRGRHRGRRIRRPLPLRTAASCSRQRLTAAGVAGGESVAAARSCVNFASGTGVVSPGVAAAMSERTFSVSPSPSKSRGPRIF